MTQVSQVRFSPKLPYLTTFLATPPVKVLENGVDYYYTIPPYSVQHFVYNTLSSNFVAFALQAYNSSTLQVVRRDWSCDLSPNTTNSYTVTAVGGNRYVRDESLPSM